MTEKYILRCEDTMDGIFTAIYDGFVLKKRITQYEDNIEIAVGDEGNMQLFVKEIEIQTDDEKANKTVQAIQRQLGFGIYQQVFFSLCHYETNRASVVFGYLTRAFQIGLQIQEYMTDPYVMKVMELSRKVSNESQKLKGFLRFRQAGEILLAEISPKCNEIPVLIDHFADRYPNENFMIYDQVRKYAFVHPKYQAGYYVYGELEEFQALQTQDEFEKLWKTYFITMEIAARHNENCQNNLLPKWYRKTMIEFTENM